MKCTYSPCGASSGNISIHQRSDNKEDSTSNKADPIKPTLSSERLSLASTNEHSISAPKAGSSLRQRISQCIERTMSRLSCTPRDNISNTEELVTEEIVELTSASTNVIHNRTTPDPDAEIYISESREESLRETFRISSILNACPFVLTFMFLPTGGIHVICRDYMDNQRRVKEELEYLGIPSKKIAIVELSELLKESATEELQPLIKTDSLEAPLAIADIDTGLGSDSENEL